MRKQSLLILTPALLTMSLPGCQSPLDDDLYDDWARRDPPQWRLSDNSIAHTSSTLLLRPGNATIDQLPPGASAEDYVRIALERNPSIRAAEARVIRFSQRKPQVTSLDDLMLMVAPIGQMAQTADGEVEIMTGVSQTLPFPGKLDARGRIAEQEAVIAQRELDAVRLKIASDTRQAYWSYYFATRAVGVVEQQQALIQQFKTTAEARYESGTASQEEVLRASVELANLGNELLMMKQRRQSAAAMLNRQMDRPIDASLPEPPNVEYGSISLKLDRLLAEAAAASPELRQVRDRIEMYRQQRDLANLNRWPDLTLGLTYNAVSAGGTAPSANGDDQWWLSFGVNVPIWSGKRDAAEREAVSGMLENIAELTGRQNDLAFRVQDALLKVETQQRMVMLFRDQIIPDARKAVEASQNTYRAGGSDFLALVDNWNRALELELMQHQSLAQLEQQFAELQRLVGHDLMRTDGDAHAPEATHENTQGMSPETVSHE